jgi:DNA polymerase I
LSLSCLLLSVTKVLRWKKRTISTKLGRLRKLSDEDKENSICNHPIQGTGADGFKMALVELDRRLAGQDAKIVHILHDEIIVEAREEIAGDVAVTVKACMERAFTEIFPDVLFVVTPEIRDTWGMSV